MDKRLFVSFANFIFGTVIGGIATNLIISLGFSGNEQVANILSCSIGDEVCISWNIILGTLFVSVIFLAVSFVVNKVWWMGVVNKINLNVPIYPEHQSDKLEIFISNRNRKDFTELSLYPRFNKEITWISKLNTTRGLDGCKFNIKHEKIRSETEIKDVLVVPSNYEGVDYPLTKFLIGQEGLFCKNYFPYEVMGKSSKDVDKIKGDLFFAVFEIIIELEGRIGEGYISKFYYGKFYHSLVAYNYVRKKYRNSYRLVKGKPRYETVLQWIEFRECNKEMLLETIRKNQNRQKDKHARAEIQTVEELLKALEPENANLNLGKNIFTRMFYKKK